MQYRLNRRRFIFAHVYLFACCLILAALTLPFTIPVFATSLLHAESTVMNSASDILTAIPPVYNLYSPDIAYIITDYLSSLISWSILFLAASMCMSISRLYDLGKDHRFLFFYMLPLINVIFFLYLCWQKGDTDANKYGPSSDSLSDSVLLSMPGYHLREPVNTSYPATLFEQSFSWEGRLNRLRYLLRGIGLLSISILTCAALSIVFVLFAGIGILLQSAVNFSNVIAGSFFIIFILFAASVFLFIGIIFTLIFLFWKIRRWHDLGHNGFFLLLTEAPYYLITSTLPAFSNSNFPTGSIISFLLTGIMFLWIICINLYLLFIKGDSGENKYGEDLLLSNRPDTLE
ncbi:DUF805 domain-containing protein [Pectinatus haikarae]